MFFQDQVYFLNGGPPGLGRFAGGPRESMDNGLRLPTTGPSLPPLSDLGGPLKGGPREGGPLGDSNERPLVELSLPPNL